MSKKPNLFIVGAPKCGTSSLHYYLDQHPDIFMSKPKEPHYFCTDLHKESDEYHQKQKRFPRRSRKEYFKVFSGARNEKIIGEASVWYLYSTIAAQNIHEFNPDAKIIIMIRNPVNFLRSLHSHLVLNRLEDLQFQDALDAEQRRKKGISLPGRVLCPSQLYYSEVSNFSEQIARYLDYFSHENIYIAIFEEFVADIKNSYKKILYFLDVDSNFEATFKVLNQNKKERSRTITNILKTDNPIKSFSKMVIPVPLRSNIRKFIHNLNVQETKRNGLDINQFNSLKNIYKSEAEKLSHLTGKDLVKFWGLES